MRTEPRTPALIPVTGAPGSGKTTLVKRVCDHYSRKGLAVSGTINRGNGGRRCKVWVQDTKLVFEGRGLACKEGRKECSHGRKVRRGPGRCRENWSKALGDLVKADENVVFDSRGGSPMEMTVVSFRKALSEVFTSANIVVASVKYGSHFRKVEEASKQRGKGTVLMNQNSRDAVIDEPVGIVDEALSRS